MSIMTLVFAASTFVAGGACYVQYVAGKPLRKKAREEAEKEAARAAEDIKRVEQFKRNKEIEALFVNWLYEVIRDPYKYRGKYVNGSSIDDFFRKVKLLHGNDAAIKDMETRQQRLSENVRAITLQYRDIQKALQMGQPVLPSDYGL